MTVTYSMYIGNKVIKRKESPIYHRLVYKINFLCTNNHQTFQ